MQRLPSRGFGHYNAILPRGTRPVTGMMTQVDRMSDSQQDNRNDKRDRWKMIASLLGATVPEEPVPEEPVLEEPVLEEPHQAISLGAESNWPSPTAAVPASTVPESTSPVAPAMEQPRAKRVHPTPAASNWNALCGELGVEVPPGRGMCGM